MIKIGLVGVGGMGQVHISNYSHLDGCRVSALCDNTEAAEKKAIEIGAAYYRDLDSMLENEKLDVADICTPTFLHCQQAEKALKKGLHVICEKPLALSSKDAAMLYHLAENQGRQLFVGQVLQFSPEAALLRELVDKKPYGNVIEGDFSRLSACPRWAKGGWLFDKNKSGLIPFDLHIHDLDLIVSLFGAPENHQVVASGGGAYPQHYRFIYQYKDKNISAQAAWYNADIPFTAVWRVAFENGVVVNDGNKVTAYQFDQAPVVFDTEETVKIPTGINLPPTGMFYHELGFFLDKIRREPQAPPYRKEEILQVIRILEAVSV